MSLISPSLAASRLKGLSSKLKKQFNVAKQYTLQKVGARKESADPPELTALIAQFGCDKQLVEELRDKVRALLSAEKSLLEAKENYESNIQLLKYTSVSVSDSASEHDSSEDARLPSVTPQQFAVNYHQLIACHRHYLQSLSSHTLDPIDALMDNDIRLASTMIKQLMSLRLNHDAKKDRRQTLEKNGALESDMTTTRDEEAAALSEYNATAEVIAKLCRELSVKREEVTRAVAAAYIEDTLHWQKHSESITLSTINEVRSAVSESLAFAPARGSAVNASENKCASAQTGDAGCEDGVEGGGEGEVNEPGAVAAAMNELVTSISAASVERSAPAAGTDVQDRPQDI